MKAVDAVTAGNYFRIMNSFQILALKSVRKLYLKFVGKTKDSQVNFPIYRDEDAGALIHNRLIKNQPLMVARLGAVEIESLANYHSILHHQKHYLSYIRGKNHHFWWDKNTMRMMANNAGFFPTKPAMLERFAEMMLQDMREVDVLGTWQAKEILFREQLAGATRVDLFDLEPYRHRNPWSRALEGKVVLVIHPFIDSITAQYSKREVLFADQRVLPNFELKTIRAVQSIANNQTYFRDWFAALDFMRDKISRTDFDVAIIGCGAYGFPLAAHVKRIGKKAIHLGGATQILFGIIGKRWEEEEVNRPVRNLMNSNWIRPFANETPQGIKKVENGCYW